jgi:aminoglycoside phosphotransferase (APT) family kinase protein
VIGPLDEVERWCRTLPPAVVLGDFRLGNLLAADERIAAVIDWEIWSVGDRRLGQSSRPRREP